MKIFCTTLALSALLLAGLAFVAPAHLSPFLLVLALAASFTVNKLVTSDKGGVFIHVKDAGIYVLARAALFAAFFSLARLAVISF